MKILFLWLTQIVLMAVLLTSCGGSGGGDEQSELNGNSDETVTVEVPATDTVSSTDPKTTPEPATEETTSPEDFSDQENKIAFAKLNLTSVDSDVTIGSFDSDQATVEVMHETQWLPLTQASWQEHEGILSVQADRIGLHKIYLPRVTVSIGKVVLLTDVDLILYANVETLVDNPSIDIVTGTKSVIHQLLLAEFLQQGASPNEADLQASTAIHQMLLDITKVDLPTALHDFNALFPIIAEEMNTLLMIIIVTLQESFLHGVFSQQLAPAGGQVTSADHSQEGSSNQFVTWLVGNLITRDITFLQQVSLGLRNIDWQRFEDVSQSCFYHTADIDRDGIIEKDDDYDGDGIPNDSDDNPYHYNLRATGSSINVPFGQQVLYQLPTQYDALINATVHHQIIHPPTAGKADIVDGYLSYESLPDSEGKDQLTVLAQSPFAIAVQSEFSYQLEPPPEAPRVIYNQLSSALSAWNQWGSVNQVGGSTIVSNDLQQVTLSIVDSGRAFLGVSIAVEAGQHYVFGVNIDEASDIPQGLDVIGVLGDIDMTHRSSPAREGRAAVVFTANKTETIIVRLGLGVSSTVQVAAAPQTMQLMLSKPYLYEFDQLTADELVPSQYVAPGVQLYVDFDRNTQYDSDGYVVNTSNADSFRLKPDSIGIAIGDSFSNARNDWIIHTENVTETYIYPLGIGGAGLGVIRDNAQANLNLAHLPDIAATPQYVVLQGGINDIVGAIDSPVETMMTHMRALIDMAREMGMKIILMNVGPWSRAAAWTETAQAYTEQYNASLQQLAESEDIPLIDAYSLLRAADDMTALADGSSGSVSYDSGDGLHPNELGHRVLGHAVAEVLVSSK